MLQLIKGDMLKSKADALVNTVNTVGVMGKGIALQFKEAFPQNNKAYIESCKKNELEPGKLLAVWDSNLLTGKKLIINFPTKVHWRQPSKYEYIEKGLIALVELIKDQNIKSIALPPLGCGNGGLDWNRVKPMISQYLANLPIDVFVFEPNNEIKEILQAEQVKKEVKLTPARAQLMYALFAYESFGEYSSLFAANKLAYFLQRMGQPLRLDFQPKPYGPYAIGVEKVLYSMNGIYLKGLEQQMAKPFEPLQLNYEKWPEISEYVQKSMTFEEARRIGNLVKLISGFTSELSLEILATTAYILDSHPSYDLKDVMKGIQEWSSRKGKLFKEEYVRIAYEHLLQYQDFPIEPKNMA
jgi:O-acetyl-ADP-ribose deacetylase (regulator of RNase III)